MSQQPLYHPSTLPTPKLNIKPSQISCRKCPNQAGIIIMQKSNANFISQMSQSLNQKDRMNKTTNKYKSNVPTISSSHAAEPYSKPGKTTTTSQMSQRPEPSKRYYLEKAQILSQMSRTKQAIFKMNVPGPHVPTVPGVWSEPL